jgi:hypothetical protein
MLDRFAEGNEIVYGVRSNRGTDSFFKRTSAQVFYKIMRLLGANIVYNHADFRLMSKKALDALSHYGEVNLFLRGIVPLLGFKTEVVYYARQERVAGTSKYPLKKMLKFAFEGLTSFSIKPIRLITLTGVIILIVACAIVVYALIRHFTGRTVWGWTSMVCSIWGIGGLILCAIGITGEYIGKIYLETKHRPRYIVEETLD